MSDPKNAIAIYEGPACVELAQPDESVTARNAPDIVKAAGKAAEFAWEEFFQAEIADAHTRKNCMYAVQTFLAWDLVGCADTPAQHSCPYLEQPGGEAAPA